MKAKHSPEQIVAKLQQAAMLASEALENWATTQAFCFPVSRFCLAASVDKLSTLLPRSLHHGDDPSSNRLRERRPGIEYLGQIGVSGRAFG